MIENDKQRTITVNQLFRLGVAYGSLLKHGNVNNLHPLIFKAQIDAVKSLRDELISDVYEYDKTKGIKNG